MCYSCGFYVYSSFSMQVLAISIENYKNVVVIFRGAKSKICHLLPLLYPFLTSSFLQERYGITEEGKPTQHLFEWKEIENILIFSSSSCAVNYFNSKPVLFPIQVEDLSKIKEVSFLKELFQKEGPRLCKHIQFLLKKRKQLAIILYRFNQTVTALKSGLSSQYQVKFVKYENFLNVKPFNGLILMIQPFKKEEADLAKILFDRLNQIGAQIEYFKLVGLMEPSQNISQFIYPILYPGTAKISKMGKNNKTKKQITVYFDIENKQGQPDQVQIDDSTIDETETPKNKPQQSALLMPTDKKNPGTGDQTIKASPQVIDIVSQEDQEELQPQIKKEKQNEKKDDQKNQLPQGQGQNTSNVEIAMQSNSIEHKLSFCSAFSIFSQGFSRKPNEKIKQIVFIKRRRHFK